MTVRKSLTNWNGTAKILDLRSRNRIRKDENRDDNYAIFGVGANIYNSSRLLSLCLVTTSVSLDPAEPADPSAEPLSSFLSLSVCWLVSPTPIVRCD